MFDSIKRIDGDGREYWLARELMPLLEYERWESFDALINRAIISLEKTYPQKEDHFREVAKMIKVGSGTDKEAVRKIRDYKLTRYACYLIAQNGDSRKEAIALAQSYFAVQTRKQELEDNKQLQLDRLKARQKLTGTEKIFSGVLTDHGVDSKGIAEIRSAGDRALFNKNTQEMKNLLGAGKNRPLADYIPTITLKAKDLATEMTTFQTKAKQLTGKDPIKQDHIHNNKEIRSVLNRNGIYPESLPAEEDIKRLERRLGKEEVQKLKTSDFSDLEELMIDLTELRDKTEIRRLRTLIDENPGDTPLRIFYGGPDDIKVITTAIQINTNTVNGLKEYIVLN